MIAALAAGVAAAISGPWGVREGTADAAPVVTASTAAPDSRSSTAPARVAAIGDSLTLHDDQPDRGRLNHSWFALMLRAEPAYEYVYNAAVAGNSTAQMRERLEDEVLAYRPDIVFVLGGVNDVASSIPTEQIIANLRAIVVDVQTSGAQAVIATTPPWNTASKRDELLDLNAAIKSLAEELGLTLIDFYAATAAPDGTWLPETTGDGLHPNAVGAELMAEEALRAMRD